MSHSRSRSPKSTSRGHSLGPDPRQLPGPTDLALTEGAVSEEAAELLHEFVHPHQHHADQTLVAEDVVDTYLEEEDEELLRRPSLPWYKRPSPLW